MKKKVKVKKVKAWVCFTGGAFEIENSGQYRIFGTEKQAQNYPHWPQSKIIPCEITYHI